MSIVYFYFACIPLLNGGREYVVCDGLMLPFAQRTETCLSTQMQDEHNVSTPAYLFSVFFALCSIFHLFVVLFFLSRFHDHLLILLPSYSPSYSLSYTPIHLLIHSTHLLSNPTLQSTTPIHLFNHSPTHLFHQSAHSLNLLSRSLTQLTQFTPSLRSSIPPVFFIRSHRNPAPVAMPSGEVRMMVHTSPAPWAGEAIVSAPSWRGPYSPLTGDVTTCSNCQEDPFLWKDKRGNWHALFHRMFDPAGKSPIPSPGWCGGHAFSADGLHWSNISRAYNTSVYTTDGTHIELKRRERPKLLFDSHGDPTHLYNGVESPNDGTYTMVSPLQTA